MFPVYLLDRTFLLKRSKLLNVINSPQKKINKNYKIEIVDEESSTS